MSTKDRDFRNNKFMDGVQFNDLTQIWKLFSSGQLQKHHEDCYNIEKIVIGTL